MKAFYAVVEAVKAGNTEAAMALAGEAAQELGCAPEEVMEDAVAWAEYEMGRDGKNVRAYRDCPECEGSGEAQVVDGEVYEDSFLVDAEVWYEPCPVCRGLGVVYED